MTYGTGFPAPSRTRSSDFIASARRDVEKYSAGGIAAARLTLLGRTIDLRLLRDNGNTLRDPFTGRHVPVVEAAVLGRLAPPMWKYEK